ncbi:hypothetical protein DH86_00000745 [Scytalidium sp. 3C]|nr:hypothetical protein DH86_00000745 [Scytalidium sp. 3C]
MSDFETAVADSRKLISRPSDSDLLKLYALYKVATGEDFDKAEQPGLFDLKGKAKYKAWKDLADAKLNQDDAKKQYIELVEELKTKHGYNA